MKIEPMDTTAIRQYDVLIDDGIKPVKSRGYFDSINPSTGETFAQVANANVEDMRSAIRAARAAFDSGRWSKLPITERGKYLVKIARLIRANAKELAELETWDTGKTTKQTTFIDVPTCADTFEYFGKIANELDKRINPVQTTVKSITEHEPIGVVGCIIPWNYPLIMAGWKMAPALVAGNTVVFKPSSTASVSVLRLAQIIEEAHLPSGVVNIVSSKDHDVADELIRSKDVNMVSFTGGTKTGQHIIQLSADTTKKLSLELGGKSPNIVFADCNFDAAIGGTMSAIFMNQGQMCTAGSRLLLEERIYERFLTALVEKTKELKIGNASDYETQFGPLVSIQHRESVLEYIKKGIQEGAKLECGGKIPIGGQFKKGAYLEPTIFSNANNRMTIAQEEIFGPVLSVIKFSDEDEAIQIANDSIYGLASMIWTKDLKKAEEAAKKIQSGVVWINTYGGFYNEASFGGYKQSGYGRELGVEGLLEYTQSKHICTDKTPGGRPLVSAWF
ncbi:MAG: aldehyde dehydrogenase family protein [Candidatus Omnitrophica bacterium]|nr:aldehyde dehydrogenase family protein [Candidatus Omnitrophota bacterium]